MTLMARFAVFAVLAAVIAFFPQATASSQVSLQRENSIHISESWSYVDCGHPEDIIQIQSINVSPDPPQPGENLTVTVKATVSETIEEGAYAIVVVKLGLIKLLQKQVDVCEEARKSNATVQCPVSEGEYEVAQTVALPKEIPPAKFSVSVRGFTVDDEDMVCIDLKANFMKKSISSFVSWPGSSS